MKFIKDLCNRIKEFILKAVGSRKFYAWAAATFFMVVGICSAEIWLAVTGLWVAAIAAEKIGTNNTEGK